MTNKLTLITGLMAKYFMTNQVKRQFKISFYIYTAK